jgi:hypothetical protein
MMVVVLLIYAKVIETPTSFCVSNYFLKNRTTNKKKFHTILCFNILKLEIFNQFNELKIFNLFLKK